MLNATYFPSFVCSPYMVCNPVQDDGLLLGLLGDNLLDEGHAKINAHPSALDSVM